jgi:hypothetical protein
VYLCSLPSRRGKHLKSSGQELEHKLQGQEYQFQGHTHDSSLSFEENISLLKESPSL